MLGVFRYSRRALSLVWQTSAGLSVAFGVLTLIAGLLPGGIAWVGKLIVDTVVAQRGPVASVQRLVAGEDLAPVLWLVAAEAGLVVLMAASQKGIEVVQYLLRALLGHRVNVMILDKALTLSLRQFENSELYDRMTQARREASSRPLALVRKTFGIAQNAISLMTYGALLVAFSPAAVLILVVAAVPAFVAETVFAGEAFRLFRWRSPETRQQMYLETVLAREDYAKEVQLFGLGPMLLDRYRAIFDKVFGEDRDLTLRRGAWGYGLSLLSTLAFYGTYGWIAVAAVRGTISLGEMTMYVMVFKQGQAAFSSMLSSIGGMYEDNLYLSNLYDYLETPGQPLRTGATEGPAPGDGIRFDDVRFSYPGATRPALHDVSMHLRPGRKLALVGENGSGKTTLIKLLCGLYVPDSGRITLDGLDLQSWDEATLRRRIGVIFQDFVRYQMLVGENIGTGDVDRLDDETGWRDAADKGLATDFIEGLPAGFHTQLGRWFQDGQELSGGQWQKIALSRAFMRDGADIVVLDEPTAAMDAEAEARIFDHFREATAQQMAILISHRFSTVRMADEIVVLAAGAVVEQGSHEQLMAADGRYAHLFRLQAAGYQ
ncbi:MAG: ABC transporter ATP-binding protein [Alphaproteobacteria bacterium]|nr:ABC transporter ATP-binding protein [Alphaproteobacteria bacterium]